MPDFDIDQALNPTTFACPACAHPAVFSAVSFPVYGEAQAVYACRRCTPPDGVRRVPAELVAVETDEAASDPMGAIRRSNCPYGCGRSSITTGKSAMNGTEMTVQMSCDSCDGTWKEFYRLAEEFDA